MPRTPADFLPGTLESLILKTLTRGAMHGYGVARWIEDTTDRALAVEEGSLYPALYRMERRGWIDAEWGTSELGRRAKFYRLTRQGRQQLAGDTEAWAVFSAAVNKVLAPGASAASRS
jgi:PadR family transcriptional regulator PadR